MPQHMVEFSDEQWDAITAAAELEQRSRASFIRRACDVALSTIVVDADSNPATLGPPIGTVRRITHEADNDTIGTVPPAHLPDPMTASAPPQSMVVTNPECRLCNCGRMTPQRPGALRCTCGHTTAMHG